MTQTFRIIARNEFSTKKKKIVFHKCKYLFLYQPRLALVLGIFSFRSDRFLNVKVPRGFFTKQASQRRRVALLLPIYIYSLASLRHSPCCTLLEIQNLQSTVCHVVIYQQSIFLKVDQCQLLNCKIFQQGRHCFKVAMGLKLCLS